MQKKTMKIIYWITTILFAAFMLFSGITELMRIESSDQLFIALGYPLYISYILGAAKVLGAFALIYPKFKTIKEWAYAGFTFDLVGAAASFMFIGGAGFFPVIMPLIILVVMFISYAMWKKLSK